MATAFTKHKSSPEATVYGARNSLEATEPGTDKGKQGHAKPLPLPDELKDLRRLRCGHLMALLSISHATLYARLSTGTIPRPDGRDGRRPYWKTSTVKALLDA